MNVSESAEKVVAKCRTRMVSGGPVFCHRLSWLEGESREPAAGEQYTGWFTPHGHRLLYRPAYCSPATRAPTLCLPGPLRLGTEKAPCKRQPALPALRE